MSQSSKDINEDIQIGRGTIISMMGPVVSWNMKPIRKKLKKLASLPEENDRHLSFRSLDRDLLAYGAYAANLERDLRIAQEAYSRCRQICLKYKAKIAVLEERNA